jgi:hypothetical protein
VHQHCVAINRISWLRYSQPPLHSLQVAQYTAAVCSPLRSTVCLHLDHTVTRLCFCAAVCNVWWHEKDFIWCSARWYIKHPLGGTRANLGPLTGNWEKFCLPQICSWQRVNQAQKPVKWCVLQWNAVFSFHSDCNTFLLLTWTADTKSGHISDVSRHMSRATCSQNVHNRPVLPWQCMQPRSAL